MVCFFLMTSSEVLFGYDKEGRIAAKVLFNQPFKRPYFFEEKHTYNNFVIKMLIRDIIILLANSLINIYCSRAAHELVRLELGSARFVKRAKFEQRFSLFY